MKPLQSIPLEEVPAQRYGTPISVCAVRIMLAASCFKAARHFFSGMEIDLEI